MVLADPRQFERILQIRLETRVGDLRDATVACMKPLDRVSPVLEPVIHPVGACQVLDDDPGIIGAVAFGDETQSLIVRFKIDDLVDNLLVVIQYYRCANPFMYIDSNLVHGLLPLLCCFVSNEARDHF